MQTFGDSDSDSDLALCSKTSSSICFLKKHSYCSRQKAHTIITLSLHFGFQHWISEADFFSLGSFTSNLDFSKGETPRSKLMKQRLPLELAIHSVRLSEVE